MQFATCVATRISTRLRSSRGWAAVSFCSLRPRQVCSRWLSLAVASARSLASFVAGYRSLQACRYVDLKRHFQADPVNNTVLWFGTRYRNDVDALLFDYNAPCEHDQVSCLLSNTVVDRVLCCRVGIITACALASPPIRFGSPKWMPWC
jgi:hypothetical protein